MKAKVYLITNRVNDKCYVGFTRLPILERWKGHVKDAIAGGRRLILRAIRKYGPENFTVQELFSGDVDEALRMESVFISRMNSFKGGGKGYNMTLGGDGVLGHQHDVVAREKMSLAVRKAIAEGRCGRPHTELTKAKMSLAKKGKPCAGAIGHLVSEETRAKISAANTGRRRSEETRARMRKPHNCGPLSANHKKQIAEAHKGMSCSEETKRKLSDLNKGKHQPDWVRQKVHAGILRYWAERKSAVITRAVGEAFERG